MSRPWLVLVGSSTGGPAVLLTLLERLPAPLPCPIVIAHHILPGFERGLVSWLGKTHHDVRVVEEPTALRPGVVYLAPGDQHLMIRHHRVILKAHDGSGFVPSVDILFRSAVEATSFRLIAALLTGMGRDGAQGLLALREAGAVTLAQSAESCAVDGMPGAARRLRAAVHSLPPIGIANVIRKTISTSENSVLRP